MKPTYFIVRRDNDGKVDKVISGISTEAYANELAAMFTNRHPSPVIHKRTEYGSIWSIPRWTAHVAVAR